MSEQTKVIEANGGVAPGSRGVIAVDMDDVLWCVADRHS